MKRGIEYNKREERDVLAYVDADWAADEDRRSQTGFVFFMAGGPVAWV